MLRSSATGFPIRTVISYLSYGALYKAQDDEGDVVRSECDDKTHSKHWVLTGEMDRLASHPISQRREDYSSHHDAKIEHRLRRLRQVVFVTDQIPL